MSKLAVIDLGTNVIKILVGSVTQKKYSLLYEAKIPVVIHPKSLLTTHITQEEKKNIIDAFITIKKKLDKDNVEFIIAKATSLLREVSNADEIIEAIYTSTSIQVEVISNKEEANLIHLGISSFLNLTNESCLVVDIGGGSTECIIFNRNQQLWEMSFLLGIRRIASQGTYSDPITPTQVNELEKYIHTILEPLLLATKLYKPNTLIGSSGAFRTLLTLYTYCYPSAYINTKNDMKVISTKQFLDIHHVILTKPMHFWEGKVAVEPIFLRLIPLSTIFINLIINECNFQEIIVSDKSLKTGLFIQEWHHLKTQKLI
ncbi:hypothetical protein [Cardinium endosymbiont of Culicoides punctatus]|uniref:Ppx/GppA phosphatase family protein n=1 Tax=Cardinium endosymbiont of Culicoides punctatus TaxID=2304601 RepID=UPI001058F9EE|nr:hypothetical protein [Cardinium endosymbiont of Culicoides punctatus]TDG94787.1 Guanosine-5'-triphosphate,3'-diphosphate pyrophosphatase [Cardinium endosymbiont of Culicoides punctatus]